MLVQNTSLHKKHNITIKGKGTQPMMFAHGFGCDQNMWNSIVPAFEEEYKIILFDHIGAGKSDLSEYDYSKYGTLNGYAEDILNICRELELKDVIFVGHSVSAMIGILAANSQPGYFSNLILIGPSPRYTNDEKSEYFGGFKKADVEGLLEMMDNNYLGWSSSIAPQIMGNTERPELGEQLTNSFCNTDPDIAKHFARVTFFSDNRDDLSKVKVPSLILQCSNDIIAPEQVGLYMHNRVPKSSFHKLKASGHCPHVSEPQETIEAIKTYLKESDED